MRDEEIARVCHEVNRAYCFALGDDSQLPWNGAPEWQKESAVKGVAFHRKDPDAPASHSHIEWMREKAEAGWKWGLVKDPEKKEHPCMVPFDDLPVSQQAKDFIFKAVVNALATDGDGG